jgi:hypothetical protein
VIHSILYCPIGRLAAGEHSQCASCILQIIA